MMSVHDWHEDKEAQEAGEEAYQEMMEKHFADSKAMTPLPSQMPDVIYVCNEPDGPDLNDVCGAALYKAVELEHNGWLHQTKYTRAASVPSDKELGEAWDRLHSYIHAFHDSTTTRQAKLDIQKLRPYFTAPDQSETIKALEDKIHSLEEQIYELENE